MPRWITVAAAQMGPINEGTSREEVVGRMLALLEQAARQGVEVLVYPEMALTPYFPKRIREDYDHFFETEVPPKALEPLLRAAGRAGVVCHVGFCEKAGARRFNTALLSDETGGLLGTYRKIHLPGQPSPDGVAQVYEVRYFESGDTGFRVFPTKKAKVGIAICQDRRYPETWRSLGLLGAEIAVIGYNTPASVQALELSELVMRAGAYENHLFIVASAKAGVEDGLELIGGSCVIGPLGQVLARAATTGDEVIAARIDLDWAAGPRKRWGFFDRRHPEHYIMEGPEMAPHTPPRSEAPRPSRGAPRQP